MAGLIYRPDVGQRVVDFFPTYLKHFKGEFAGRPFTLEPWQADPLRRAFGTFREDGSRAVREMLWAVARKNGKTHLAAGLGLVGLFADREPGAEVYCAASDREQAALIFDAASTMVESSPMLRSRCEPYRRSIVVPQTASVFKVLSAEAYTKHGLNASMVLIDELHAQPGRELHDVLKTSQGSRRQPLFITITTAGWDKNSICWEVWEYARRVRDGVVDDPSFLPVIFETDSEEDWTSPEVWAKANPNLGVSVKLEFLEAECRRAQEIPSYENTFRRLYLNQWTEQAERWLPVDKWKAAQREVPLEDLEGRLCFAAMDLSATTDLTVFGLLFPTPYGFHWVPFYFMPEAAVQTRTRRDRVPFDEWVRRGHLEVTPGDVVDYDFIRERVNRLGERFRVQDCAIDPWNATQLSTQLASDGVPMVNFRQGYASMSAPSKELEKAILAGSISHCGNPVMDWNVGNVAVKTDPAGNIKPDKAASGDRIDGVVALVMALGRAMVTPESPPGYSAERGLRML